MIILTNKEVKEMLGKYFTFYDNKKEAFKEAVKTLIEIMESEKEENSFLRHEFREEIIKRRKKLEKKFSKQLELEEDKERYENLRGILL